jgi:hypothetical protein
MDNTELENGIEFVDAIPEDSFVDFVEEEAFVDLVAEREMDHSNCFCDECTCPKTAHCLETFFCRMCGKTCTPFAAWMHVILWKAVE